MSFLPMPKTIGKSIRSLQINFMWGGDEVSRRMAWIKWENICKSKEEGGLGVRNMLWFNSALLGKWLWRFLSERDQLWIRILKSRHGELICNHEGVRTEMRSTRRSGWWRNIISSIQGDGGRWMWGNLESVLGDGGSSSFWCGTWAGTTVLKNRFPRLFNLSSDKYGKVDQMVKWSEGKWEWVFNWRRNLLDREKGWVDEMVAVLQNFNLREGIPDGGRWGRKATGVYTVKEAYMEITRSDSAASSLLSFSGRMLQGVELCRALQSPGYGLAIVVGSCPDL